MLSEVRTNRRSHTDKRETDEQREIRTVEEDFHRHDMEEHLVHGDTQQVGDTPMEGLDDREDPEEKDGVSDPLRERAQTPIAELPKKRAEWHGRGW